MYKNKIIFILSVLSLLGYLHCKGTSSPIYLIKKNLPKSEYTRSNKNDIIISSSRKEYTAKRVKVTFMYWRFIGANTKKINFQYEEHYQILKDKPDLKDLRSFPITNNIIEVDGFKITIFELKPNVITYQIKKIENETNP